MAASEVFKKAFVALAALFKIKTLQFILEFTQFILEFTHLNITLKFYGHFRSPLVRSTDPQAQIWDPTAAYEHLVTAFKHDPYTCACFSKGFQMLHGVMAEEAGKGAKFTPQIYAHRIPSYFGMIAATFIKK